MNGSTLAELSVELMADSTCQTVQIFHACLEDDVLGTAWSMRCHYNNLGSSQHSNLHSNLPRSLFSSLLPHLHLLRYEVVDSFFPLYIYHPCLWVLLLHSPFLLSSLMTLFVT